jgi:hypothetical protein
MVRSEYPVSKMTGLSEQAAHLTDIKVKLQMFAVAEMTRRDDPQAQMLDSPYFK